MIVASLPDCRIYESLHPHFRKAFDALLQTDFSRLEDGKYPIDGQRIYMTVGRYPLRRTDEAPIEVHDRFIDIQYVIEGCEGYGWKSREACREPQGAMDRERDILFFRDTPSTVFTLEPGRFAVFFPQDGHAPLIGEGEVRKCIIKVAVG